MAGRPHPTDLRPGAQVIITSGQHAGHRGLVRYTTRRESDPRPALVTVWIFDLNATFGFRPQQVRALTSIERHTFAARLADRMNLAAM